jgi:hypothetical protein
MTSIGGKIGRRGFATPDNQGMVRKANARLESQVASDNARLENALAVDGVKMLVWRRRPEGGPVCSCHADVAKEDRRTAAEAADGPLLGETDGYEIVGHKHPQSTKAPPITSANFDNPLDDIEFAPTTRAVEGVDPLTGHAVDELMFDDESGDEDDVGSAPRNPLGSNTAAGVACPVCAGATYRDGWQPSNGHRAVMSFLSVDSFDTEAIIDDSTKPFSAIIEAGQTLQWDVKLPRMFSDVVRCQLWSGKVPLAGDEYRPEVFDGIKWIPATRKNLLRINNDKKFTFRLIFPKRTIVTHFDCIVILSDLPVGQFPPLNAPYDHEFLEYLTNITIEVGASLHIRPGDLLSDHKFFKMWRVTNATRKFTAGGRTRSTSLDLRVVTATEALFALHPFDKYEERGVKPFASKLETFQGNS